MSRYQKGAKDRNLSFVLTREEFENIIKQDCYYCGAGLREYRISKDLYLQCNGIDRMDNSLGYEPTNCRSCCNTCNVMKRSQSISGYVAQGKKVADKWKSTDIVSSGIFTERSTN